MDDTDDIDEKRYENVLRLNESQTTACINLKKFIKSKKNYNFLLLGPGGSGKTTVIVNVFNDSSYKIAFCAFTNKATQVLSNISNKFSINFQADFLTIHKLLALELRYVDNDLNIAFKFDKTKIDHLAEYDILIFDECSTISADLYSYIVQAVEHIEATKGRKLKCIFLGDYWQLPPVGEEKSVIFQESSNKGWPVSKLTKVMRSGNDKMRTINDLLLSWIDKIKQQSKDAEGRSFMSKYPYNLLPRKLGNYIDQHGFMEKYAELMSAGIDCVIVTYSRANCTKTNYYIQDLIDQAANRPIVEKREDIKFYPGDRCCLDKVVDLYKVETIIKPRDRSGISDMLGMAAGNVSYVQYGESTGNTLYNGEIFDIIDAEEVDIKTPLNRFNYNPAVFRGQRLIIARPANRAERYEILHIYPSQIDKARALVRSRERRMVYISIMTDFIKKYPKLDYGYCITIYKSQGSEWHTVFINISSIKWCIVGDRVPNRKKLVALFKSTYTALSRASNDLYCFWT
jgi:DNA polymerase III delta prime subunit